MKLSQIYLYRYNKPFLFTFSSAHLERTSADSVIVHLVYNNGIEGYGECAPRPYVTGEDAESVLTRFKDAFIPILFSSPIQCLEDIYSILSLSESQNNRGENYNINSSLCALELSLLDALAKSMNVASPSLFGMTSPKPIPRSLSIPIMPAGELRKLFGKLRCPPIEHVKIIAGKDIEEVLERILVARELLGEHVNIRLEVNERWSFRETATNIERVQKYNIFAIEQPLRRDCIEDLKQLKTLSPIPIILDESICSLEEAKKYIQAELCDVINIKISKCGGIMKSMRIFEYARANNIRCQLGAHVGESPILTAAGKAFANIAHGLLFTENYSELLFSTNFAASKPGDLNEKGLCVANEVFQEICQNSKLVCFRQG